MSGEPMDRHLSPEHDGSALNKIDMQGDPGFDK
jgi:hypothetical protein